MKTYLAIALLLFSAVGFGQNPNKETVLLGTRGDTSIQRQSAGVARVAAGPGYSSPDGDLEVQNLTVKGTLSGSGAVTPVTLGPNTFFCDATTIPTQYANYKACVDAANAVSGAAATVQTLVPGLYSIPATVVFGSNRNAAGTGANVKVTAIWGMGVQFSCDMADYSNCLEFADGSGYIGYGKTTGAASLSTVNVTNILVPATSKVANIIAPQTPDGFSQGSFFGDGVTMSVRGDIIGCAVNFQGMQSGTYINNTQINAISGSTYAHRWAQFCFTNPSKKTFTPDSVSGDGTTVTVTCGAGCPSTTFPLLLARAWKDTWVAVGNCSISAFNGTYQVTGLTDGTGKNFTYTAAASGSPTSCQYKVTQPTEIFAHSNIVNAINTVITLFNNVLNCSGLTNCQNILISTSDQASGGSVGDLKFYATDPEGCDPAIGIGCVEMNGNGLGNGFGAINTVEFYGGHMEPKNGLAAGGACGNGFGIKDASGIKIDGFGFTGCGAVSGSGGTGNAINIDQSSSNRTSGVQVVGVQNQNWPNTLNNAITSYAKALTAFPPDTFTYTYGGKNSTAAQGETVIDGTLSMPNMLLTATAPTISSGFGSSPSIPNNNGTAAFTVNVGTGGSASSGVIGLPTASTGWNCSCTDVTTNSSTVFACKQTASSTASATIGNFNTSAAAAAWVASDILRVSCFAY